MSQSLDNSLNNLDVGEFMSMMDIVDIERSQGKAVTEQLSEGDRRKALVDKLRDTYKEMGAEVSESLIKRAVDDHFSKRWEFEPAKDGLGKSLLNGYINRGWITKAIIIPTVVAGSLVTASVFAIKAGINAHYRGLERDVENNVEEGYVFKGNLEGSIKDASSSPFLKQLPGNEVEEFNSHSSIAERTLNGTDSFFDEFCPEGVSDDVITQENYEEVSGDYDNILSSIELASGEINSAVGLLTRQEEFVSLSKGLENLVGQVRTSKPHALLGKKGEKYYADGVASIDNRKIESAREAHGNLSNTVRDIEDYSHLSEQYNQLSVSAREVAVGDNAKGKSQSLIESGKIYVNSADVGNMRSNIRELRELNNLLNQKYELRIVSKPGVRSGEIRNYRDENGIRRSGYYAIVEPTDSNGKLVSLNILSVETGGTKSVTRFGIRVDDDRWESIKSDMKDNGIVDNNVVGRKNKGYLEREMIMEGVEDKYITEGKGW